MIELNTKPNKIVVDENNQIIHYHYGVTRDSGKEYIIVNTENGELGIMEITSDGAVELFEKIKDYYTPKSYWKNGNERLSAGNFYHHLFPELLKQI